MSKMDHVYIRICNWLPPAFFWIKRLCWNETETVGLHMRDELWRVTGTLTAISVVSF